MNGQALSPISVDSTDWSPFTGNSSATTTRTTTAATTPSSIARSNLADSTSGSGHSSANSTTATDGAMQNPSPPSSVSRSSGGTVGGNSMDPRKQAMVEETFAEHHRALLIFLNPYLQNQPSDARQNRALDKLLRLSFGQFQELSTDVYDELQRREEERRRGGPNSVGNPIPKYLLPRQNFHIKRNQARQRLATLPRERFQQLATDVFYELERRFPKFSRAPSRNGLPPRTASRGPPDGGPMMMMPPPPNSGFRRPPPSMGGPQSGIQPGLDNLPNELGRALPRIYQNTRELPTKGTLVEDDSGAEDVRAMAPSKFNGSPDPMPPDYRSQMSELERKIDALEIQLQQRDQQLVVARTSPRGPTPNLAAQTTLQISLESKLKDVEALNDSLKSEISKVRLNMAEIEEDLRTELEKARRSERDKERDLRAQLEDLRRSGREAEQDLRTQLEEARDAVVTRGITMDGSGDGDWQQRYEGLERELAEQQRTTDEVRKQAAEFLQEMRALSQQSIDAVEKEEALSEKISQLELELREWKSRYARTKTQGPSLRSSSLGPPLANGSAVQYAQNSAFTSPNGVIKDFHITNYQLAIDEILRVARRPDSEALLESMKDVIKSIRSITTDLDTWSALDGNQTISAKEVTKLKSRLSQTANNLITASKSHASSGGLTPVSLIDAAASHLTNSVMELVRLVKIRPTSPEEMEQEEMNLLNAKPAPLNSRGKSTFSDSSRGSGHNRDASRGGSESSAAYSLYSRFSGGYTNSLSPQREEPNGEVKGLGINQAMSMLRESGIEEFKNYLEDTTAVLVRNIQPLVSKIRSAPSSSAVDSAQIADGVREISNTIQDIVSQTKMAVKDSNNKALQKHAPPVVNVLEASRSILLSRQEEGDRDAIPVVAFKIARTTKELLLRVERIDNGELTANMDLPNEI